MNNCTKCTVYLTLYTFSQDSKGDYIEKGTEDEKTNLNPKNDIPEPTRPVPRLNPDAPSPTISLSTHFYSDLDQDGDISKDTRQQHTDKHPERQLSHISSARSSLGTV